MRPRLSPIVSGVLALAVFLWLSPVWAQDFVAVHVEYTAPSPCPPAAELSRAVQRRTDKVRIVGADDAWARSYTIAIREDAAGAVAELTLLQPNTPPSTRSVPGATCESVVRALGLIIALAVDPEAKRVLADDDEPVLPTPPSATTDPPPPEPAASPEPTVDSKPLRRPEASRSSEPRDVPPSRPRPADRWRFGAGAQVAQVGAVAPGVTTAFGATLGAWRDRRGTPVDPSFRAQFFRSLERSVTVTDGRGVFRWTAAALSACPVRAVWRDLLAVTPCAVLEVGALRVNGEDTPEPQSSRRPWLAPGLEGVVILNPSGAVFFWLAGRASVPAVRARYFIIPNETVYEMPVITASGHAGVGVHFL